MSDVYGAQGGTMAAQGVSKGTQPVKATKGQEYGKRGRQETAQQVIPLSRTGLPPGSLTPLAAPSDRPGEPVTTGLPSGPGAGPEALMAQGPADDALWELRALAARFPSRDLARMIALAESEL